jgi:hypothetical protein
VLAAVPKGKQFTDKSGVSPEVADGISKTLRTDYVEIDYVFIHDSGEVTKQLSLPQRGICNASIGRDIGM